MIRYESGATTSEAYIGSALEEVMGSAVRQKMREMAQKMNLLPTNYVTTRPKMDLKCFYEEGKLLYMTAEVRFDDRCVDKYGKFVDPGAIGAVLDNVVNAQQQLLFDAYAFTLDLKLKFEKMIPIEEAGLLIAKSKIVEFSDDNKTTRARVVCDLLSGDEQTLYVTTSSRLVRPKARQTQNYSLKKLSPIIVRLKDTVNEDELLTDWHREFADKRPVRFVATKLEGLTTNFDFREDFADLFEENGMMFDCASSEYFDFWGDYNMIDYKIHDLNSASAVFNMFARGPPPNLVHGGASYAFAHELTFQIARKIFNFFVKCDRLDVKYISSINVEDLVSVEIKIQHEKRIIQIRLTANGKLTNVAEAEFSPIWKNISYDEAKKQFGVSSTLSRAEKRKAYLACSSVSAL